jgi:tetratricopeptide (TPR) repeat protein
MTDAPLPGHDEHVERLFMLADVEAGLGNVNAALKETKRAVEASLRSGDVPLAIRSLARQAQMLISLMQYRRARNAVSRAFALAERAKDKSGITLCYYILGQVEFHSGHIAAAEGLYRNCLRRARANDIREAEATVLHQLGVIDFLRRDYGTAERYLNRALPMLLAMGETETAARSRYQLGMVRRGRGQYARAEEDFRAALELARQAGSTIVTGQCLQAAGDVCLAQGNFASARQALDECIKLRRDTNDRPSLANSLNTSS